MNSTLPQLNLYIQVDVKFVINSPLIDVAKISVRTINVVNIMLVKSILSIL